MIVPFPLEKKRLLLGGALLLTVGTSVWLNLEDGKAGDTDGVVEVVKSQAIAKNKADRHPAEPALFLPVLADAHGKNPEDADGKPSQATDIFKSHAWYVPPPPPSPDQPVAAEPPAPPPLPFTYLGKMDDDGHTVFFLAKQQRLYTVRKGEVFDGQYRLEDEGKGRIEFIYLPLNTKQTLVIKGAS